MRAMRPRPEVRHIAPSLSKNAHQLTGMDYKLSTLIHKADAIFHVLPHIISAP